jgi:signal transduction histidine kinase/CheY-like chemotaxis protein
MKKQTKRNSMIFLVILFIGTLLGVVGTVSYPIQSNLSCLWPAAVVQALGGVFFGIWGVVAGIVFPIFSNMLTDGHQTQIIGWIPANFVQSFLPYLVKKLFHFSSYKFNKKTVLCFVIGCVLISGILGGAIGCSALYFADVAITGKEIFNSFITWITGYIPIALFFGLIFLKTLGPALKDCNLLMNEDDDGDENITENQKNSVFLKIFILMLAISTGPLLLFGLYELFNFHSVIYGKNDPLMMVLGFVILFSIAIAGYIAHDITIPIRLLIKNIQNYRLKRAKPNFTELSRADEFGYVFKEYERMVEEVEQYQAELLNKTQLATIGGTVAMIVHDIRKPLTAIQMFLQTLPKIKSESNIIENITYDIEKSIVHTNTMLNDILEFSHEEPQLDLQNQSIPNLIAKALQEVLRVNSRVKVNFSYNFCHGKKGIYVDELRIIRVLVNVITNALEAMAEGSRGNNIYGNIAFTTAFFSKDNKQGIKLIIEDDGPGISPEVIEKIYDPFFSYGKKNGNGLGLTICKNLMLAHEGEISIKNREHGNSGVEVTLLFKEGQEVHDDNNLQLLIAGNNRPQKNVIENKSNQQLAILIVDDELTVRTLLRSSIIALFKNDNLLKVAEAVSAEEALLLLKDCNFSHVITDIDFGQNFMNGYDFAESILKLYPNLYVLIHSNKINLGLDETIKKVFGKRFLGSVQKPIVEQDLAKLLLNYQAQENRVYKKVLLLNDDAAIASSMKKLLSHYNMDVCWVANVADAVNSFANNCYDFILSDINLGNSQEDGYTFLKKVRLVNKTIPFIIMSGYNKNSEQEKATMCGATAYIQTPFKVEVLLELL